MKQGVSQLLIASAMDADLRRRLLESPDETFQGFDLTEEEKDLLRHPDQRLLRLFGAALAERQKSSEPSPSHTPEAAQQPLTVIQARTLPSISLAVTLVPCAQYENEHLKQFAYALWVNPLAEGADPASLPPPPGATLPGQPLTPLHAVIQVSAVQLPDRDGKPHVELTASLRQSSNVTAPPPPESAGMPETGPFGSDLRSVEVIAAVAAVHDASGEDRYDRLIDLIHVLKGGEVR
jgi:hypothetical protein